MSTPVVLARGNRIPLRNRLLPLTVVGIAHLIGRLSPRRIRKVLAWCAGKARPATYAEALRARRTVVAVSMRCAGNGCVPRSIATALLCRVHGSWPTWHTGARTVPFAAHAWVTAEGRAVDEPHTTSHIRPLISVSARP